MSSHDKVFSSNDKNIDNLKLTSLEILSMSRNFFHLVSTFAYL